MKKEARKCQEVSDGINEIKKKSEKITIHAKTEGGFKAHYTFDDIWKQLTCLEKKAKNEWEIRFSHLLHKNFEKVLLQKCADMPALNIQKDIKCMKNSQNEQFKKGEILKPSPSIPKNSAADIGWRSSRSEYNLEIMGKLYISPRHTIEPPVSPNEFRVTKQSFIFLG